MQSPRTACCGMLLIKTDGEEEKKGKVHVVCVPVGDFGGLQFCASKHFFFYFPNNDIYSYIKTLQIPVL